MRHRSPPTLVYRGVERTVTPDIIVRLVKDGMTSADYEGLDLVRDYYGFPTIGTLITDALARCGEYEPHPPRTGPYFKKGGAV